MKINASANLTFSPGFKRLLVIIAVLNGLVGVKRIIESFSAPEIFKKDFIQEYLMAKAILAGVNPYLPLPQLADIWMSYANYQRLKHPTPHPPTVGLLGLPFGFLSYEKASVAWLIVELVCLSGAVVLLSRWWGKPVKAQTLGLLFVAALGWVPVMEDLWFGQLTVCLLLLLLGAWLALRAERNALGGGLLGVLIALKLMAWPIVIFLALRRKWSAVVSAGAVAAAANLLAAGVLGIDSVKDYYLKVGPLVALIYRTHDGNYSSWTLGARFFAGFGNNFLVPPLLPSTSLAWLLTYLAPAVVLFFGLRLALRAGNFDTAFGLLVGVAILVSPIAWTHYLMLSSIPMVIIARRLWLQGFPRRMSYLAFCLWLLISIAGASYSYLARLFTTQITPEGEPVVPVVAGLLTLIPAAALLGILRLVWLTDRVEAPLRHLVASGTEPDGLAVRWLRASHVFFGRR